MVTTRSNKFQTPPRTTTNNTHRRTTTSNAVEASSVTSSTASSVAASASPSRNYTHRETRSNKSSLLPRATHSALLRLLVSPSRHSKFSQVCDTNPLLYGTPGSTLRKSVQNRKLRLQKLQFENVDEFVSVCSYYGVHSSDQPAIVSASPLPDHHQSIDQHQSPTPRANQPSPSPKPTIKPRPDTTMAMFRKSVLPAVYKHDEQFTLNLDFPERNPDGMMAFRASKWLTRLQSISRSTTREITRRSRPFSTRMEVGSW
jgi:hypothetical protein